MSTLRKLQTEIDRLLKKIQEGIAEFNEIWDKVHTAVNANQKEKYEADLKREIKKLQRYRDQIKTWCSSNEIKDKSTLVSARRSIETEMERFKVCEKETKTKPYSKEGLQQMKPDPHEGPKAECRAWITRNLSLLQEQIDHIEAQIEALKAKKKRDGLKELEDNMQHHAFHVTQLEKLMRCLENDAVTVEEANNIEDDVNYFIEENQNPDFLFNEDVYAELNLDAADVDPLIAGGDPDETTATPPSPLQPKASTPMPPPSPSTSTRSLADPSATTPPVLPTPPGLPAPPGSSKLPPLHPRAAGPSNPGRPASPPKASPPLASSASAPGSSSAPAAGRPAASPSTRLSPSSSSPPSAPSPLPARSPAPSPPTTPTAPRAPTQILSHHPPPTPPSPGQQYRGAVRPGAPAGYPQPALNPAGPATHAPQQPQPQQQQQQQQRSSPAPQPQPQQPQPSPPQQQQAQAQQQQQQHQSPREAASETLEDVIAHSVPGTASAAAPPAAALASVASAPAAQPQAAAPAAASSAPAPQQAIPAPTKVPGTRPDPMQMLEASFRTMPDPQEALRPRPYVARYPHASPAYFPQQPLRSLKDPARFATFDPDTLFFIFYFQQGTYEQYLAAKELKKQAWRYHRKYNTWFQRHSDPTDLKDDYEEGTYVYFDHGETGWCQRVKEKFRFDYQFLEDEA
ncbi:putative CCR4-NOT transcription complex subunit 3 [Paratrimastix pyriformis]|uniref:CCR4-NOT transcription complex subunit 3 n=1 Tax=Paratrimastix pyriformis TaxID=342808 RepID=A0ABQ8UAW5_9EUKA|nr:putative CCR4-NOT transcription complex subunit 3 [Paratrimastix pyriformis]